MKPSAISFFLAIALAISSSSYSQGQQAMSADSRVRFDFTVMNKKSWRFVDGLKKEDFSIYEDGGKQEVIGVSRSERPLSIVLLVDLSGSMHEIIEPTRLVTLQALQNLKPEDEVAIITFAKNISIVQEFTKDKSLVKDRISNLTLNKELGRATRLDEAVYRAVVYMKASSNAASRRILFVVTDNIADRFPKTFKEAAVREVSSFGGIVCSLVVPHGLERERPYNFTVPPKVGPQSRQDGVPTSQSELPRYLPNGTGNIDEFARETGGIVLYFNEDGEGTKRAAMIDLLRNFYTVEYQPSKPKRDGKFRKVKLRVFPDVEKREGSLVVLSRQGYQAN